MTATAKRILVVDDSPTVVDMVRHLLEGEGYTVLAALNGLAAVNTAFREVPDLVVSDVEMPEMTGLQLCRLLKGDPRTQAVPFLILSVHKEQYEQFWGRETGADDYLPKPFTPEALLDRVRVLLARYPRSQAAIPAAEVPATTRIEALEQVNASLDRRLFELTIAHGVSAIAATTTGEREAAQAVLERLSRLVDFSAATLSFAGDGESYVLIRKATTPGALQELHTACLAALPASAVEPPLPGLLSGAELVSARAFGEGSCLALQPMRTLGNLIGVLGVAREPGRPFDDPERDLLELVASQAALVLGNARLAEAEREHAEQLRQRNEELQRLNATIGDLIRSVTHDLRTPLGSVIGYMELVGDDPGATAQQREFLGIARRNADRMMRMVHDLLDLSRLEAGRTPLDLQPTDLAAAVSEAMLTMRPALRERSQSCEADLPPGLPRVMADSARLHEILLNLMSNASKYGREGGSIRVEARPDGDRMRVAVRDTGIGLSEDDLRQVFRKFFRAKRPETAGVTGTGLGLAIVKTLVELHGGEVFVESALNEGSTFGFLLPAGPQG